MRLLELFSGVGSVSMAVQGKHEVVCGVDINELAMKVFRCNFQSSVATQEITSLSFPQLREWDAEMWWMSPPCQPFTRRGQQRDLADPRSKALLHLFDAIDEIRPTHVAIENVIGFENSRAFMKLKEVLDRCGYRWLAKSLCASELGVPNLRPRFFVMASRYAMPNWPEPQKMTRSTVADHLDPCSETVSARWGDLYVLASQLEKYGHAVNVVDPTSSITRCFTSAYGRSFVRSGSYLQQGDRFRRFSPREVASLLGFPSSFRLPEELTTRQLWKLLGNAVSVPCARHVIKAFDFG